MLLERIDKMAEFYNLLLDRLNIRNGSEGLALVSLQEAFLCANCSRFDRVELECPVMAIQGQGMFRHGPSRGSTQHGRSNYPAAYPNYYNTHVINNNPLQYAVFRRNNNQPYPPSYSGQQQHQQLHTNKKQSFLSHKRNRKLSCKPHARPRRHVTQSSEQSHN